MKKIRLDLLLVDRELVPSRQKAQALILAGRVLVNGQPVLKPGHPVDQDSEIKLVESFAYVGRGGAKLEQGLKTFPVNPAGKISLDIGASTGGFTDCLLQFGARKVFSVDVNIKQLDWKLRQNPRVLALRKNARYLEPEDLPEIPEIAVVDVSFISVLKILPAIKKIMPSGDLLVLIKPQFEAGRKQVGKKGIIKDRKVHQQVLEKVLTQAQTSGFGVKGLLACSVLGQKGNQEFLVWFQPGIRPLAEDKLKNLIQETLLDEGKEKD
jgi:23S rRNA (cytidine1920-2'-O)/16S rRNA (cytidine1409-2'-O)-methyltransferase